MISVCTFHTCIAEAFKHVTEAYSNLIKNFIMLTKKCLIVLKLMKPQNETIIWTWRRQLLQMNQANVSTEYFKLKYVDSGVKLDNKY